MGDVTKSNTQTKRMLIADHAFAVALAMFSDLKITAAGHRDETANSADGAFAKFRQSAYAQFPADYKMPDINGLDLARAIEGTKVRAPTPPADPSLIISLNKRLDRLISNTDSLCVLMLSSEGYPLDVVGSMDTLDIHSVGALLSVNLSASEALAKLLGSNSVFKSSCREVLEYNIYTHDVNQELLLAVIFHPETGSSTIWHYAKKAAVEIGWLVKNQPNFRH